MPIPEAFDLSGRVAVVTGAGSPDGIGFTTARLLAELGAAVMISATTDRIQDRVSELRSAGFDAAGVAGNLTEGSAAAGLVSAALDRCFVLDIVVNNAGMIFRRCSPCSSPARWSPWTWQPGRRRSPAT